MENYYTFSLHLLEISFKPFLKPKDILKNIQNERSRFTFGQQSGAEIQEAG